MKRLKKLDIQNDQEKQEAIEKAFSKVDGVQVVGLSRIKHPNQDAYNVYTLETGETFIEDDTGKKMKIPNAKKRQKNKAK